MFFFLRPTTQQHLGEPLKLRFSFTVKNPNSRLRIDDDVQKEIYRHYDFYPHAASGSKHVEKGSLNADFVFLTK